MARKKKLRRSADFLRRSRAAKKGWATRRRHELERSRAAKKGWAKRRKNLRARAWVWTERLFWFTDRGFLLEKWKDLPLGRKSWGADYELYNADGDEIGGGSLKFPVDSENLDGALSIYYAQGRGLIENKKTGTYENGMSVELVELRVSDRS